MGTILRRRVAGDFRALHAAPGILVLPNAWDAASAALMQYAGAKAVATSSAAVAWAHGYPDGDALPVATLIAALREIARVITVPLTADIEGGYTDDLDALADTVATVIDAGAAGINLEDGRRAPELHARKIASARRAADAARADLFINARTDVYLARLAEGEAAFEETVRRAARYRDAGADGIFVPGPADEALIGRLAQVIALPLNIMVRPGVPAAARLQALGVRRLSSATGPFHVAYSALFNSLRGYLGEGDSAAFAPVGEPLPDLNARFRQGP